MFGAKSVLLPSEGPIHAVWALVGVCFLRKEVPLAEVEPQLCQQEILRAFLGDGASERGTCARLFNLVAVPDDIPRRADANEKFLFLLRPEKAHVPIPDVELRRHHLVGLFQPDLALAEALRLLLDLYTHLPPTP